MGSALILLLLPCVVSGYLLVNAKVFRAKFPEKTGSNLYFRILLAGSFWVLGWDFALRFLGGDFLKDFRQYSPYLDLELILATLFSLAARVMLDCSVPVTPLQMLQCQAKHLELFIAEAIGKNQLIMVTLSSEKVYVGKAIEMNFSGKTPEWLMIWPLASGYQYRTSKDVELTIYYLAAYEQAKGEYGDKWPSMILSAKDVVSIQMFDPELHAVFQRQAGKNR